MVPEIENIIRTNSRVPDVVVGDLRGQVGSTRLGAERLIALSDEYGVDTLVEAMQSLIDRTRTRVKAEIRVLAGWRGRGRGLYGFTTGQI